ncbi:MAG TPA: hypothetical protein VMD76_11835, partial [Candidatus Sulfotelmatobacter sp.]|nr:hypothetical protein [Candidatus Sulfotelmatobacter sp.]
MARLLTVSLAAALLLALPARAEDAADVPPSCHNGMIGGVNCFVTKQDVKQAKEAFKRGIKILDPQHLGAQNVDEQDPQTLAEALAEFEKASRLAPQNVQYLTAREAVRSKLVFGHIQSGNELMLKQARLRAATEFRAALDLDPDNEFAKERYADATRENEPSPAASAFAGELAEKLAESTELHLEPAGDRATFHYTGDARGLFEQLGAAYKINVQFDDSVKRQEVRFNLDDVDFFTALNLACRVSKTMWTALDTHQVLIAEDSTQNHKQFDRFSLRTFYLPPQDTPQEATGLMNLVRNMFDLKFISLGQTADTIEVRGPAGTLDAAAQMLQQLSHPRPEVMLDLRVYQISHQLTRNIGLHAPNTFNLYNIPAIALAG